MQYLVNKYSDGDSAKEALYPSDPETRANVDRILFFDIGSLYKSLVDYFVSLVSHPSPAAPATGVAGVASTTLLIQTCFSTHS